MSFLNNKKNIFLIITGIIVFILIIVILKSLPKKPQNVSLTLWGYNIEPDVLQPLIDNFEAQNPQVKINYYQKDFDSYYDTLISAYANQNAPDMFLLPGNWLPLLENHIYPLNLQKDKELNQKVINDTYPPIVQQELKEGDYLLGIPLSIDTLVLYYNPSIFKYYNISKPPTSWEELKQLVPKLRKINPQKQITFAAIALGAPNVDWQTDILSNLMIQANSDISDPQQKLFTYYNQPYNSPIKDSPVLFAFKEYTQFANPLSPLYTWNQNISNSSLKAFSEGKVAMIFAYAQDEKIIHQYAPDLGELKAPFPGINNSVFYGKTLNIVVSNQSKNPEICWQFLKYLSSKDTSDTFSKLTNLPPSRLDLINENMANPTMKIFAQQALLSKSWYQFNYQLIDKDFSDAVIKIINNSQPLSVVLGQMTENLERLWRQQNQ